MKKLTLKTKVQFGRQGRRTIATVAKSPLPVATGRVPRVSRLMALAIKLDGMIRSGAIKDQAEVARIGRISRARASQILNLVQLAPDIQAQLLFLPTFDRGRAPIILGDLQPIASELNWRKQRRIWRKSAQMERHLPARSGQDPG